MQRSAVLVLLAAVAEQVATQQQPLPVWQLQVVMPLTLLWLVRRRQRLCHDNHQRRQFARQHTLSLRLRLLPRCMCHLTLPRQQPHQRRHKNCAIGFLRAQKMVRFTTTTVLRAPCAGTSPPLRRRAAWRRALRRIETAFVLDKQGGLLSTRRRKRRRGVTQHVVKQWSAQLTRVSVRGRADEGSDHY